MVISTASSHALDITIHPQSKTAFDCDITLSGPIVEGDAERSLRALKKLSDRENRTVCLNSTGGAYNEGIQLADAFRQFSFSTKVLAGARCLSSCAVAFMGGGWDSASGEGVLSHRLIAPSSRLGFHAPFLRVGGTDYNEANVRGAYKQATASIGRLLDVSQRIDFDMALVREMLFRGESELYYIDTIEKLGRFGIGLHGYAPISNEKWRKFHSCWNIYSWRNRKITFDLYNFFHRGENEAFIRKYILDESQAYREDPTSFQEGDADYAFVPGDFTILCKTDFGNAETSFLGVPAQEDYYREIPGPQDEQPPPTGVVPAWSRLDGALHLSQVEPGSLVDLPFAIGHRPDGAASGN